jgi:hypothetical protein
MKKVAFALLLTTAAVARTGFWAPVAPPRAHYAIKAKFIPDASRLEGSETIRFRNDTLRPIGRIALDWYGEILSVRATASWRRLHRENRASRSSTCLATFRPAARSISRSIFAHP